MPDNKSLDLETQARLAHNTKFREVVGQLPLSQSASDSSDTNSVQSASSTGDSDGSTTTEQRIGSEPTPRKQHRRKRRLPNLRKSRSAHSNNSQHCTEIPLSDESADGGLPGLSDFQQTDLFQRLVQECQSQTAHENEDVAQAEVLSDSAVSEPAPTLRRIKSSHSSNASDIPSAAHSLGADEPLLPERRPGRLRRFKSAHEASTDNNFFSSVRATLGLEREDPNMTLDDKNIKHIDKELHSINARLAEHYQVRYSERAQFLSNLRGMIAQWDDRDKINLSNILISAKQPSLQLASLSDQNSSQDHDSQKRKYELRAQLRGIGQEILLLLGERAFTYDDDNNVLRGDNRFSLHEWLGGYNNCLAVIEDRNEKIKFILKCAATTRDAILEQTSFLHAYANQLSVRAGAEQPVSEIYEFIFVDDKANFLPGYGDDNQAGGEINIIQVAAYYHNSIDLRKKYAHFDQAVQDDSLTINRIYHATNDWLSITHGLLYLYSKGIIFTDIKGDNYMEHIKNSHATIIDFKTAQVEKNSAANIVKKIKDIQLTPGTFYESAVRADNTVPVIYLMCQAIMLAYYRAITGHKPYLNTEQSTLDLDDLPKINSQPIVWLRSFFLKWETLLSPKEPTYRDLVYLEVMVKHLALLQQKLAPHIVAHRTVSLDELRSTLEFAEIETVAEDTATLGEGASVTSAEVDDADNSRLLIG